MRKKECTAWKRRLRGTSLRLAALLFGITAFVSWGVVRDIGEKNRAIAPKGVSSSPGSYVKVGETLLYYTMGQNIDVWGLVGTSYYGSTFANGGYKVSLKVNTNSAQQMYCANGGILNGVKFEASIAQQGELARVSYILTNTNDEDVTISMGTHADVQIGSNDSAPISRKLDSNGIPYGLSMRDGSGRQLCVLFGAGIAGIEAVDDYWFGRYSQNSAAEQMVGNYTQGSNWMQENSSYDSGMGWCWKNRTLRAGESKIFSWLIGVGDVNIEPTSSFIATSDDLDDWNDLSIPHNITLNGEYESPAGISGYIEYAIEDSDDWQPLTEELASGDSFSADIVATFKPDVNLHRIRFRTVDAVGNTTMLPAMVIKDIAFQTFSGVSDMPYNYGEPIEIESISSTLEPEEYSLENFANNVNVGIATFDIVGVFPKTIGKREGTFRIVPVALTGGIEFDDAEGLLFNGAAQKPAWHFTDEVNSELVLGTDYIESWLSNLYAGTAKLNVSGCGNYTGTLTATFEIGKSEIPEGVVHVNIPGQDGSANYNGNSYWASVSFSSYRDEAGGVTITYKLHEEGAEETASAPVEPGTYDVYVEIGEGRSYLAVEKWLAGSFTIYSIDEGERAVIAELYEALTAAGAQLSWDVENGYSYTGVTMREGHVTGINLPAAAYNVEFPTALLKFPYLVDLRASNCGLTGNVAEIIAGMTADGATLPALEQLVVNGNALSGNIGELAALFPSLTSLNVSSNRFTEISPVISENITSFAYNNQDLGGMTWDVAIDADADASAAYAAVPTVLTYNHYDRSYRNPVSIYLLWSDSAQEDAKPECGIIVSVGDNSITSDAYYSIGKGNRIYYGESGTHLDIVSMGHTNFGVNLTFIDGDSNLDGKISIQDVQNVAYFAMYDNNYSGLFAYNAADMRHDGRINVQDVVCVVDKLCSQTPAVQPASLNTLAAEYRPLAYCSNGNLVISSAEDVAAFDVTVEGIVADRIPALDAQGFDYRVVHGNGMSRIVAYSIGGAHLDTGVTEICPVDGSGKVVAAELVNEEAQLIQTAAFSDKPSSGIEAIYDGDNSLTVDGKTLTVNLDAPASTACCRLYALDGRLVATGVANVAGISAPVFSIANIASGIYIITIEVDGRSVGTHKINIKK